MIFPKKCLGCPPFLRYICWPKVVGAPLLLSAPLALLSFRRPWFSQSAKLKNDKKAISQKRYFSNSLIIDDFFIIITKIAFLSDFFVYSHRKGFCIAQWISTGVIRNPGVPPAQSRCSARSYTYATIDSTYVSGVAKLPWRNHVIQNLRAYFLTHVSTIKWIMYVCRKIVNCLACHKEQD